jgi:hypothetical protein
MVSSRFFAKGALPTNPAAEVGGIKVIGLPHLSVRVLLMELCLLVTLSYPLL